MEEWRDVPGFEGKYQISISTKEGKCRSLNFNNKGITMLLSNKVGKKDYIKWALCKDGKSKADQAARWIAITYPDLVQNEWFEGAEIDHIDTDPLNNNPSNLRWVSHKGNMNNPLTRIHQSNRVFTNEHRQRISESNTNNPAYSKPVIQITSTGNIIYPSLAQAERETGICKQSIISCCKGKYKTAGGYKWKYAS